MTLRKKHFENSMWEVENAGNLQHFLLFTQYFLSFMILATFDLLSTYLFNLKQSEIGKWYL